MRDAATVASRSAALPASRTGQQVEQGLEQAGTPPCRRRRPRSGRRPSRDSGRVDDRRWSNCACISATRRTRATWACRPCPCSSRIPVTWPSGARSGHLHQAAGAQGASDEYSSCSVDGTGLVWPFGRRGRGSICTSRSIFRRFNRAISTGRNSMVRIDSGALGRPTPGSRRALPWESDSESFFLLGLIFAFDVVDLPAQRRRRHRDRRPGLNPADHGRSTGDRPGAGDEQRRTRSTRSSRNRRINPPPCRAEPVRADHPLL